STAASCSGSASGSSDRRDLRAVRRGRDRAARSTGCYHRQLPMNEEGILSFSAPLVGRRRLIATPAPVLELAYAYYYLMRRFEEGASSDLPWVRQLHESGPVGLEPLKRAWSDADLRGAGTELLLMACSLGYALDGTPQRFLADLPNLPA